MPKKKRARLGGGGGGDISLIKFHTKTKILKIRNCFDLLSSAYLCASSLRRIRQDQKSSAKSSLFAPNLRDHHVDTTNSAPLSNAEFLTASSNWFEETFDVWKFDDGMTEGVNAVTDGIDAPVRTRAERNNSAFLFHLHHCILTVQKLLVEPI